MWQHTIWQVDATRCRIGGSPRYSADHLDDYNHLLAASAIPIGVPINIMGRNNVRSRSDNSTSLAYMRPGDGSTATEQYLASRPGAPGNMAPISPGDTVILRSLLTGLFCRLAPAPANYPLQNSGASAKTPESVAARAQAQQGPAGGGCQQLSRHEGRTSCMCYLWACRKSAHSRHCHGDDIHWLGTDLPRHATGADVRQQDARAQQHAAQTARSLKGPS